MAKTAISPCNFDLFLTVFIDYGHIYVPNRYFWGATSRPHIGDLVMNLFFLLWGPTFTTGNDPKMVHFGPKIAKHGRLVNVPKWFKRVQKGPKWSTKVFLTIWDPFWAHLNPFGPFQTKIYFVLRSISYFVHFGKKILFCLKWP